MGTNISRKGGLEIPIFLLLQNMNPSLTCDKWMIISPTTLVTYWECTFRFSNELPFTSNNQETWSEIFPFNFDWFPFLPDNKCHWYSCRLKVILSLNSFPFVNITLPNLIEKNKLKLLSFYPPLKNKIKKEKPSHYTLSFQFVTTTRVQHSFCDVFDTSLVSITKKQICNWNFLDPC